MSFLARSDVGELRRRTGWMAVGMIVAFLALLGRAAELQLLRGDLHRQRALDNITGLAELPTTRGVIRDARGRVLAANRASYDVFVVPSVLDFDETWPRLVGLLGLSPAEAAEQKTKLEALAAKDSSRRNQQILLAVDVGRDVVAALETQQAELVGVDVVPGTVRHYPYGKSTAHVVGYLREVDAETLEREQDRGYRPGDRVGAVGVERRWESYLRGERGWRKVLRATRSAAKARLARDARFREEQEARTLPQPSQVQPVPGRDLTLTLDAELQEAAAEALRSFRAGAVVVVDVHTGRLLASYSSPAVEPDVASGAEGAEGVRAAFKAADSNPLRPARDRTTSAEYPPGSTFKPFTALAALGDGTISARTRVTCRGRHRFGNRWFGCNGVHGQVSLHEAMLESCNTFFYTLAERLELDRLAETATAFGFGAKTGLGLNPEIAGSVPTRSSYMREGDGRFRGGFTLLSAIGQGSTSVSVLQVALAYAALANGGTLYQPQVVSSIEGSDGTVVQDFPPRVLREIPLNPTHLALVKAGLLAGVTDRKGTAHAASLPGVDVAGKTGTAEVGDALPAGLSPAEAEFFRRDHAWFAGYAPAADPEIAIVVVAEHGGSGGKQAAPVAMRIVREWQKLKEARAAEDAAGRAASEEVTP